MCKADTHHTTTISRNYKLSNKLMFPPQISSAVLPLIHKSTHLSTDLWGSTWIHLVSALSPSSAAACPFYSEGIMGDVQSWRRLKGFIRPAQTMSSWAFLKAYLTGTISTWTPGKTILRLGNKAHLTQTIPPIKSVGYIRNDFKHTFCFLWRKPLNSAGGSLRAPIPKLLK